MHMKKVTMMFGALAVAVATQAGAKELNNNSARYLQVDDLSQQAQVKAVLGCVSNQVGVIKSNKGYVVATCDGLTTSKAAKVDCRTGAVTSVNNTRLPAVTAESRLAVKGLCR
jgi:hypothetical protein